MVATSNKKAIKMKPQEVIDEVKASGLRGRGGAGFPTGVKWGFVPPNNTKPVYLICNCDESEPGTFKDRYIVHQDPHQLIEGMLISCYAVGAKVAYIYIREEFPEGAKILEKAIEEARSKKLLGKKILGTKFDCEIYVHRGAGAYICGEETGLIESLEGRGHILESSRLTFLLRLDFTCAQPLSITLNPFVTLSML